MDDTFIDLFKTFDCAKERFGLMMAFLILEFIFKTLYSSAKFLIGLFGSRSRRGRGREMGRGRGGGPGRGRGRGRGRDVT